MKTLRLAARPFHVVVFSLATHIASAFVFFISCTCYLMAAPRFGSCSAVVNNDVPFYEEGIPYYARPPGFTQPRIFSAYEPTINTCGILPSRPLSPLPSARDPYTQLVRSPSAIPAAPNHVHTAAAAADMRHACHATDYEVSFFCNDSRPAQTIACLEWPPNAIAV